jgi:hypothetical protein
VIRGGRYNLDFALAVEKIQTKENVFFRLATSSVSAASQSWIEKKILFLFSFQFLHSKGKSGAISNEQNNNGVFITDDFVALCVHRYSSECLLCLLLSCDFVRAGIMQ